MRTFKNLKNMKFGNLTVLDESPIRKKNQTYWKCKCVCGNEKYIFQGNLIKGLSKSCGCLIYCNRKRHRSKIHRDNKLSRTLNGMKQRCYNPNNSNYKNYGGRGIKICDEWIKNSNSFYKWSRENGYISNVNTFECTIDRIDVNGDYCPSNCRWVPMKTQQNNKRNNRNITINGVSMTISQWATKYGITHEGFLYKYNHNLF